jgi:hypothetical protein
VPRVVQAACLALAGSLIVVPTRAATDLDALMREVLAKRDDNWKKLQQYILEEREQIEVRGPTHQPLWGERREYAWFIRDGYFIRSPVTINGARLGDAERRKYEAAFLQRTKERDERRVAFESRPPSADPQPPTAETSPSVDGLLKQVREPGFVSSAYFLRFKFEEGTYAFAGHEMLDGLDTLRVEYFPTELFTEQQRRRLARNPGREDPRDAEVRRLLNKVALVTLWVEPAAHQIVKYTFDNIDLDFLPGRWLVQLTSLKASMTMGQPFPEVWLPRDLEFLAAADVAGGRLDARWTINYHDYRQPDVKTRIDVVPQ